MKINMNSKIKNLIFFVIIFILSAIIFIPFIKGHFSTDTYYIYSEGYLTYTRLNSLKDGRIVMGAISEAANFLKLPIETFISILTVLAIATASGTVVLLKNIILRYKKVNNIFEEIILILFCYFTIFNFMFIENMHFVECFAMALSIQLYLLAANTIVKKERYYILESLILLFIGVVCYQGTFSMYLISLLVLNLIDNRNKKETLKKLCIGMILAVFSIILLMIFIKMVGAILNVQQARISGITDIFNNFIIIIFYLYKLITCTGYVFPKYLYIIFVLLILTLSIIKIITSKQNKAIIFEQLAIVVFAIAFGVAISLISSFGFWSARIRYSIGTTIGFLMINLFCKIDLFKPKDILSKVIIIVFSLYGIITIINFTAIINNAILVNKKDKDLAIEINNYICEYENKNDLKVKNICVVPGITNSKAYYKDLKYANSVLSWSAMRTSWSIKGALKYYTKNDLQLIDSTEYLYKEYIEKVDYEKEYLCIDDTLIVSYYIN